ncbi:MAG: hypothetical protein JRC60_04440 [Deltaproteobacteria bacterium]|nr:hypothetical protein [Deltaproteobacteria bacterium]
MSGVITTTAYREKMAEAARGGAAPPAITDIAFGTGTAPYTVDNTGLQAEFLRKAVASVTRSGLMVSAAGNIQGSEAVDKQITEAGIFAGTTLVGRKVFGIKELEVEATMDLTFDFQF